MSSKRPFIFSACLLIATLSACGGPDFSAVLQGVDSGTDASDAHLDLPPLLCPQCGAGGPSPETGDAATEGSMQDTSVDAGLESGVDATLANDGFASDGPGPVDTSFGDADASIDTDTSREAAGASDATHVGGDSGVLVCSGSGGSVCGATCVNLQTDNSNCGQCGQVCARGTRCAGGSCVCDFTSGCNGCCSSRTTCVQNQSDTTCGANGAACTNCSTSGGPCNVGTGQCCAAGQILCSDTCAAPAPANHCGTSCTMACPGPTNTTTGSAACAGTSCTLACNASTPAMCNGACVDLQNDSQNCGSCGLSCGMGTAGYGCVQGKCTCVAATSNGLACTRPGGAAGVCYSGQCLLPMLSQGCSIDADCVPGGCLNTICLGTVDVPGFVSCDDAVLSCPSAQGCTLNFSSLAPPATCGGSGGASGVGAITCDGPSDCPTNGDCCVGPSNSATCIPQSPAGLVGSGCTAASTPYVGFTILCDPRNPATSCPAGKTCGLPGPPFGFSCQ